MEKSFYDCKICMGTSEEPVVTHCGHLYCWSCIYQWSQSKNAEVVPCPLCNAEVDINKIIPLYTSQENHKKKKEDIPKRPQPENRQYERANRGQNNANFQFHFNFFGFGMQGQAGGNRVAGFGMMLIPFVFIIMFNILPWLCNIVVDSLFFPSELHKNDLIVQKIGDATIIGFDDDFDEILDSVVILMLVLLVILIPVTLVKIRSCMQRIQQRAQQAN